MSLQCLGYASAHLALLRQVHLFSAVIPFNHRIHWKNCDQTEMERRTVVGIWTGKRAVYEGASGAQRAAGNDAMDKGNTNEEDQNENGEDGRRREQAYSAESAQG